MNKKSDRRDELLKIAAQVFYEKGFAQTTLQDIADRMNFTKPAIYYYANSKEALFVEIYEGIVVGAIERARVEAQTAGSGRERFERLIAAHMRIFIENVQANSILEVARGVLSAETQSRMKFLEREYSSILRAVHSEGVADGTLADVDSGLVVNTVLGACNTLHRWYDPSGAASPDKFVESILQLLGSGFNNRQN
jgi:AcrR family transcriptional regulator